MRWRFAALLLVCLAAWGPSGGPSLSEYIRAREDAPRGVRSRVEQGLRAKLGKSVKQRETNDRPELGAAKAVVATAFFLGSDAKQAVTAAVEAHNLVLDNVPPPIAVHYEWLTLIGRRPERPAAELALDFPKSYGEQLAPELVVHWEAAINSGRLPDLLVEPTIETLKATRTRMRPLLLDKLRVLARLAREHPVASGIRRAEIEADLRSLDAELARAFKSVAGRPEVVDPAKPPYDRLRMELEDEGLSPTDEDKYLDPAAPPPPPREVPAEPEPELPAVPPDPKGRALVEPDVPPPPRPPPAQLRPGDPSNPTAGKAELFEITEAYKNRLARASKAWVGTPYEWGGAREQAGTDAPGFARALFLDAFAVDLPRTCPDQYRMGQSVPKASLKPGDLLFFDATDDGRVDHVAIFAGDGKLLHASPTKGVVFDKLTDKRFSRAYRGARRVLMYPASNAP
ncbi:MAG: C40 family peptidase [Deltaproteobacteria bacterium]|nr:C40 family peptidase [Deltaproteobacteria bacterium]